MGMIAAFAAISREELDTLRADASDVGQMIFDRLQAGDPEQAVDIDKSWAAIHFLLTGIQWGGEPPESLPVLGGTAIGENLGYGPARFLEPDQVKLASAALDRISVSELKNRFVPEKLEAAEVYPAGNWVDEGEEGFEYIAHWYEQLRSFYEASARNGKAVLLALV